MQFIQKCNVLQRNQVDFIFILAILAFFAIKAA